MSQRSIDIIREEEKVISNYLIATLDDRSKRLTPWFYFKLYQWLDLMEEWKQFDNSSKKVYNG